jgi:ribose transport system permease protein
MSLGRSEPLADARGPGRLVRLVLGTRELTLAILVLAIIAGMSLASPFFLSLANFRAIVIGMAPTAIIAIGMTVLLASGGFDLSVGSVLALSSTIAAFLLIMGVPITLAVAAALVLGAVIGLVNGIVVTKIGVNPLVATLGSMLIVRGIALVLTEGFSLSNLPPEFGWAGRAEVIGIPFVLWVTVLLVLVFDLAMRNGTFFRKIYYIGSNEKAARLSGLAVDRVRVLAYMLSGTLAAFAGVLLASRLMSGTPTAGNALELQVLAAAVIGGASLRGGEGTILGAFLGVIFVALINNAMTMLAVSIYWQMIVTGAVLVLAVALDMLVLRRQE